MQQRCRTERACQKHIDNSANSVRRSYDIVGGLHKYPNNYFISGILLFDLQQITIRSLNCRDDVIVDTSECGDNATSHVHMLVVTGSPLQEACVGGVRAGVHITNEARKSSYVSESAIVIGIRGSTVNCSLCPLSLEEADLDSPPMCPSDIRTGFCVIDVRLSHLQLRLSGLA
jgi:hypothetical protein